MSDKALQKKIHTLETVFNRIYRERMSDMPMINRKLSVHAVGFQRWNQDYLGILITPWFMNLMLLPGDSKNWSGLQELGKQTHLFPSGRYEFIIGREQHIGTYQMCSLFSPMFEFASDQSALETAEIIMQELMNSENQDELHIKPEQLEQIWKGERQDQLASEEQPVEPARNPEHPSLGEKLQKPISRRQLMRGMFGSAED